MKSKKRADEPVVPEAGWPPTLWCKRWNLSLSFYYRLPPNLKPQVVMVGSKPIITAASEKAWLKRMEARTPLVLQERREQVARGKKRGRKPKQRPNANTSTAA
jgi:hypothetical protein